MLPHNVLIQWKDIILYTKACTVKPNRKCRRAMPLAMPQNSIHFSKHCHGNLHFDQMNTTQNPKLVVAPAWLSIVLVCATPLTILHLVKKLLKHCGTESFANTRIRFRVLETHLPAPWSLSLQAPPPHCAPLMQECMRDWTGCPYPLMLHRWIGI